MTKRRRGIFKTRRAATAAKTRAQTGSDHPNIPATVDAATKLEAVKAAAAQHKRSQRTNPAT